VNAFAEIIPCENARVDLDKILGLGTFMMSRVEQFMDPEDEQEQVCRFLVSVIDPDPYIHLVSY
jgi:hypothetical protein